MKNLKLFLVLMVFLMACTQKKIKFDNYTTSIKDFQFRKNSDLQDQHASPLSNKDLKNFKGLDFFPIDSTYKVRARIFKTPDEKPFEMATNTARRSLELKYGEAHFILKGRTLKLSLYQNLDSGATQASGDYLFLPFSDKTNGGETYGGGRYIDLKIPEGDTIIIDFNRSYNPYCVYNDIYSCPIPPRENRLPIAIEAGVKNYEK